MEKVLYPKEIQRFFNEVVSEIREILDPESIIIAGSFGKKSWLYFEDRLISDFEFVFVCKQSWSVTKKNYLLKRLNSTYPYNISLKGYLLKNVENKIISNFTKRSHTYISLNYFDTFSCPVVLFEKKKDQIKINLHSSEIPIWEAWRLYVNRIGDLLSLLVTKDQSVTMENYYWLKIFESTADTYLIINNLYVKNISERINLFTEDLLKRDTQLGAIERESYPLIKEALMARNLHDLSVFSINETSVSKRHEIVNSWMKHIEEKLIQEENLQELGTDFVENYFQNKKINKKYLELNNVFAVQISNIIRLIFNLVALVKLRFKVYKICISWRHLVINNVSCLFKEYSSGSNSFIKTKSILSLVLYKKQVNRLSPLELIVLSLKLWKKLR